MSPGADFLVEGELDLVVIGGGPGGYVAAIKAGQLGLKVIDQRLTYERLLSL
jgi:pyruvate/2-oxoglutarate dehydrogenase complex dihydrolipoamide dehydrogenase (E3) component